jgi:hypothetical protein
MAKISETLSVVAVWGPRGPVFNMTQTTLDIFKMTPSQFHRQKNSTFHEQTILREAYIPTQETVMAPTKSTKATVSADALEDTQFSINGTEPQDDGHSESEPPKKKRKKANQKAKKNKKSTDPPSAQIDAEAAEDEDSAAQAKDDDTTKEDVKSPVKPAVTASSSSKPTPTAIAELKRRKKEKTKAKQKLRKEKAIQLKGVKEEQVSFSFIP